MVIQEQEVKKGDTIQVHYTGSFPDGSVFDSSEGKEPIEFIVGEGRVVSGFEKSVVGMNQGEEKEFDLAPEEAYGSKNQDLIKLFPKERFPDKEKLKPGQILGFTSPEGITYRAVVDHLDGGSVFLDFNHLLAGKKLHFKVKIIKIG